MLHNIKKEYNEEETTNYKKEKYTFSQIHNKVTISLHFYVYYTIIGETNTLTVRLSNIYRQYMLYFSAEFVIQEIFRIQQISTFYN